MKLSSSKILIYLHSCAPLLLSNFGTFSRLVFNVWCRCVLLMVNELVKRILKQSYNISYTVADIFSFTYLGRTPMISLRYYFFFLSLFLELSSKNYSHYFNLLSSNLLKIEVSMIKNISKFASVAHGGIPTG